MQLLRILINSLLISFLLIAATAQAKAADNTAMGKKLENRLFDVVYKKDWPALEKMTAPSFQSVNSDQIRNRAQAMSYIESLKLKEYTLSNFQTTENAKGNILVVTYEVNYTEDVGSKPQAGKQTKNMSVWENHDGKWLWLAHAVLD